MSAILLIALSIAFVVGLFLIRLLLEILLGEHGLLAN